jgi:integrase
MPDVRPIQIQKLLDKLAKTHAPATVNHVRTLLHRIYEVGTRYDFVNTNPVKKTERMVVDNVNNRILTPQEEERFIEVCLEELDNPSAACLLFSLCTGPRITNNCQVKWEDIDLEDNTMLLEKTKTNKQHLLPLSDEAISILQKMQSQRAGPYVFSKDPSGLKPISYPRSVFTRLCKKAGISTTGALHNGREDFPAKPVTIHCLRKTNVSRLLQKHNDIYLCKEILGHSDIKVAGRYAFYLSEQLKRSVNGVIKLPMMELPPVGHSKNYSK